MAQQTDSFEFKDENARFGIKDEWMNKPLHIGGQKQQTAVEWLVEQIKSDQNQKALSASEWMEVIEQAKQMEREQIIKAASVVLWNNSSNSTKAAEQYYNETYKINM